MGDGNWVLGLREGDGVDHGKGYRDLVAWQRAMDLAVMVYEVTSSFPREEVYGMTSQMRRAAVSVPSNIAEGHGAGAGRFSSHLDIAFGSLMELETQIDLCVRVKLITEVSSKTLLDQVTSVAKPLSGMRKYAAKKKLSKGVVP